MKPEVDPPKKKKLRFNPREWFQINLTKNKSSINIILVACTLQNPFRVLFKTIFRTPNSGMLNETIAHQSTHLTSHTYSPMSDIYTYFIFLPSCKNYIFLWGFYFFIFYFIFFMLSYIYFKHFKTIIVVLDVFVEKDYMSSLKMLQLIFGGAEIVTEEMRKNVSNIC